MSLFDFLFLDETTAELLANLSAIVGILAFVSSVIFFIFRSVSFAKEYARGFHKNISGIYLAYATNLQLPSNGRFIHDIVEFRKTITGGYIGQIVYSVNEERNHQIYLKQSKSNPTIYEGKWENLDHRNYFGTLQLASKETPESKVLSGIWTGTTHAEEINGGRWVFLLSDVARNNDEVISLLFNQDLNLLGSKDLIDDIVKRHITHVDNTFTYGNLSIFIPSGIFNPQLGKVSIELLETAVKKIDSRNLGAVLDVGCGSGFYSIYFLDQGVPKVVGTDINENAVEKSKFNAIRNGISTSRIDFRLSTRIDPFSAISFGEKFDLIIANLPFTASELCGQYKGNDLYDSFATTKELLVNFILGAQVHLTDNGIILMTFGTSGYLETLRAAVKLTLLDLIPVEEIQHKDECFQIYMLRFKNGVFSIR